MKSFSELPLSAPLRSNLAKHGFVDPTPVQALAIEPALAGRDLVATAQTGTGKTLAFVLPILQTLSSLPKEPATTGIRALVRKILRRENYEVLEAGSGEEAVETAAAHPGRIDVLLTDVMLPGMNGRQLAEALVAARPAIKVIYVSGYTGDESLEFPPGAQFLATTSRRAQPLRYRRCPLAAPPRARKSSLCAMERRSSHEAYRPLGGTSRVLRHRQS